jgi:uncharacterized protein YkwD
MAGENIAAGTKTWAETFHVWQTSPGHNANLLQAQAGQHWGRRRPQQSD